MAGDRCRDRRSCSTRAKRYRWNHGGLREGLQARCAHAMLLHREIHEFQLQCGGTLPDSKISISRVHKPRIARERIRITSFVGELRTVGIRGHMGAGFHLFPPSAEMSGTEKNAAREKVSIHLLPPL